MMRKSNEGLSRRRAIQLASVAGASSLLAGCSLSGDSDEGDPSSGGEMGERVPTMTMTYFTGHVATPYQETVVPLITGYWEELGVQAEPTPTEVGEIVGATWNDERVSPFQIWIHSPSLFRLDPQTMLRRFRIDYAGGDGQPNTANYASCEASAHIDRIITAPTVEERESAAYDAQEQISQDLAILPMMPRVVRGAWNTNRVEVNPGDNGMSSTNVEMYNTLSAPHDDSIVINTDPFLTERLNMLNTAEQRVISVWSGLIHSPLFFYDENLNFIHVLADDFEVSDEGRQTTIDIVEDATFQNGDEITADDAVWTFETIRENADNWPHASKNDGEFEVIDDKQFRATFPEPNLGLLTLLFSRWGIMHPDTWEPDLLENPKEYEPSPEEIIASGPYRVADFQSGDFLSLEPYRDHHHYSPENPLFLQAHQDTGTAVEAFLGGEIDILTNITAGNISRIQEAAPEETTQIHQAPAFTPEPLYPQLQYPPTQFREFRLAAGTALNLDEINELGNLGGSKPDPYAAVFMETHPFRPPSERLTRYTNDVSGDIERAREILEENGWSWDDEGRLHYPSDADLTPLWPQGEGPKPEDFECINGDGEYVGLQGS